MTAKTLLLAACATLALVPASLAAQPTPAAGAAPAPAGPPITHGPALPGVCVVNSDEAIATSTAGKFVATRLQQIASQVNAELTPEQTAIQTEEGATQQARATTDPAVWQTRVANLQLRYSNFQKKVELRNRELEATRQKAYGRVIQELNGVMPTIYQGAHCSILLNGDAVFVSNPAMNVTPQAITALNAKLQQFQFDREHLDTQPATPPPAR
jgi:Skp family chaperone for outer membrane proteins